MRLGEKFAETYGSISGRRVLANLGEGPRIETTFEDDGELLGISVHGIGTYEAVRRVTNELYGEGNGVYTTDEGDLIYWTGTGLGKQVGTGSGTTWRVSLYYQTTSERFARLNETVGIGQFEVDSEGNVRSEVWELR